MIGRGQVVPMCCPREMSRAAGITPGGRSYDSSMWVQEKRRLSAPFLFATRVAPTERREPRLHYQMTTLSSGFATILSPGLQSKACAKASMFA